ncbi:MAG: HEAT repeat domain-containing protein, partial [Vicinamibacteraceae bacterium]
MRPRPFEKLRIVLRAAGLAMAASSVAFGQAAPVRPPAPAGASAPPTVAPGPTPPPPTAPGRAAPGQAAPAAKTLAAAIDELGKLDYAVRTAASAAVRRAPAEQAVPALMTAVTSHGDGYVRFRALVLLAGIGDPRTRDVMIPAVDDVNDRLREVAYAWLEWNPEPSLAPKLIAKLETEVSEFVRP